MVGCCSSSAVVLMANAIEALLEDFFKFYGSLGGTPDQNEFLTFEENTNLSFGNVLPFVSIKMTHG